MNCIRSRSILLFFRRLILLCWFWFYFCFWCENNLLFYFIKIKIKFTPEHTQLYGEWLNEKKAQKERKKTLHFFLLFGSRAIIDFWSTVWWFCVFLFYFFSLSRSLFLLLLLFVVIYYGCCCSLFCSDSITTILPFSLVLQIYNNFFACVFAGWLRFPKTRLLLADGKKDWESAFLVVSNVALLPATCCCCCCWPVCKGI